MHCLGRPVSFDALVSSASRRPSSSCSRFAVGFWLMRRRRPRRPQRGRPSRRPRRLRRRGRTPTPRRRPRRRPRRTTIRTETEIAPTLEEPQMRLDHGETADDYVRRARFPRSSQPIEDGVDPIARDREVTRGKSVGPEGTNPTLVVWPERTGFEAPSPIVHLRLPRPRRAQGRAEGDRTARSAPSKAVSSPALEFNDDGTNGDATSERPRLHRRRGAGSRARARVQRRAAGRGARRDQAAARSASRRPASSTASRSRI